ncbi:hypothetical protein GCM10025768_18360 [Microbacterium pseudoresistens]|uniref:DUF3093 domain-containing protein n=1 Tax=Microbacterium pseudoresistens TaxID=640634 RepID=A0A7Y9EX20_9MICO|nr:DUF3093 domain-containing protein [Microbacterium pseudoresistens]NYD55530.1 hypothetical protein [Microbacterium pseudoresistens]
MQNLDADTRSSSSRGDDPAAAVLYRERLTPGLWLFLGAAVIGPMIALTALRLVPALALAIGVASTAVILVLIVVLSPRLKVQGTTLHAGRAHIDARWLGAPEIRTGEAARAARGPDLPARGWHLIRGGIPGLVIVPITDPADPAPRWTISTRTPDRLAAAIDAARATAARADAD